MIPLVRDRGAVHANFRGQKKRDFEEDLLFDRRQALRDDVKQEFAPGRWKKAKPQLLAETSGKCAYCEAPTHEVAFGDVEHYRPKSEYWWLAYNYDNYLASCQLCNQKFKKAKFPITNAKLRRPVVRSNSSDENLNSKIGTLGPDPTDQAQVDAFEALHDQERPLLLNPYFDQPDLFYAWEADDALREVRIVPATPEGAAVVQAAIADFGLDRSQLRRSRYREFNIYKTFRQALDDPGISVATRQILQQTLAEKVYTIWDYIFRNVPTPVPDRESDKLPEGFDLRDLTAYYYGAVTAADDLVGDVMEALEQAGVADNTIVVLSSDHGENLGSHHWFNKDLLLEESYRVPMIYRYPAGIEPRVNRGQIASMIDVMPTLLDLAGLEAAEHVDGQSLLPVLRGEKETLPRNQAIIETEFYHIGIRTPTHLYGMEIRDTEFIDEWPYFSNAPGAERICLFDLESDPYQHRNIAGQGEHAEMEAELRRKLTAWNDGTPWPAGGPPALPDWMRKR